jgi:predicted GIY-YIG superfamily endonuclease
MHSCPPKTYFVYILTNRSQTLYTGVTGNLMSRVREHKAGIGGGFAAKYKVDRLVYFRVRQPRVERPKSRVVQTSCV